MREVLQCIVVLGATCDTQKHARLRALCERTTRALSSTTATTGASRDVVANTLFAPLRVACCTLRGRTALALALHGMRGVCALVTAHLVDDAIAYAPPPPAEDDEAATSRPRSTFFAVSDVTRDAALQPVALTRGMLLVDAVITLTDGVVAAHARECDDGGSGHAADATASDACGVLREAVRCVCALIRSSECGMCAARLRTAFDVAWRATCALASSSHGDAFVTTEKATLELIEHAVHTVLQRASDACVVARASATSAASAAAATARDVLLGDAVWLVARLAREVAAAQHATTAARVLLLRALVQAPTSLRTTAAFARVVRDDVWRCFTASSSLRDVTVLVREYRNVLTWRAPRYVLEQLLQSTGGGDDDASAHTASTSTAADSVDAARLHCVGELLGDAALLAEWYVNFDCTPCVPNAVQLLVRCLCALVSAARLRSARHGKASTEALTRALRLLVVLLRSLDALAHDDAASTTTTASAALQQRIARKRAYEAMLRTCNEAHDVDGALAAARACGMLTSSDDDDDSVAVARWLHTCGELDAGVVGQYVCRNTPRARAVLRALVAQHDLARCSVDEALRRVLHSFRLHGEAEAVDAAVQTFAELYCEQNGDACGSVDEVVALAFAIVMLHTDAHSPQVRAKMTLDEFVRNCRGMARDGGDFAPTLLAGVYGRVTSRPFAVRPSVATWSSWPTHAPRDSTTTTAHDARDDDDEVARYVTTLCEPAVATAVLLDTWYTLLPTVSLALEECGEANVNVAQAALRVFWHGISIASRRDSGCHTPRKALVSVLFTFTRLTGLRAMHEGNVRATAMLLRVAAQFGNTLGDAWFDVVRCLLLLDQLHSVASDLTTTSSAVTMHAGDKDTASTTRRTPRSDAAASSSSSSSSVTSTASSPHASRTAAVTTSSVGNEHDSSSSGSTTTTSAAMSARALHDVEVHNARLVAAHVDAATVDKFVTRASATLDDDALLDLLVALCGVTAEEAQQQQLSSSSRCVLLLQRLVEVVRANATRLCRTWSHAWSRLCARVHALCPLLRHASVAFIAVNSLRHTTLALLDAHSDAVARRGDGGDGDTDSEGDAAHARCASPLPQLLMLYTAVLTTLRRRSDDDVCDGDGDEETMTTLADDRDNDVAAANTRALYELVEASLDQIVLTHGRHVCAASWPVLLRALSLCARSCTTTARAVADTLTRVTCAHFDAASPSTTSSVTRRSSDAWTALMRAWATLARGARACEYDDDDDRTALRLSVRTQHAGDDGDARACRDVAVSAVWHLRLTLALRSCTSAADDDVSDDNASTTRMASDKDRYDDTSSSSSLHALYAALVDALSWPCDATATTDTAAAAVRALVCRRRCGAHDTGARASLLSQRQQAQGVAALASLVATAANAHVASSALDALDDVAAAAMTVVVHDAQLHTRQAWLRVFATCYVDLIDTCAARCVQQLQPQQPLSPSLCDVHNAPRTHTRSDKGVRVTMWLDDVLGAHAHDHDATARLHKAMLCALRCAARMHANMTCRNDDDNDDDNVCGAHVLRVVDAVLRHVCAHTPAAVAVVPDAATAARGDGRGVAVVTCSHAAWTGVCVLEQLVHAIDDVMTRAATHDNSADERAALSLWRQVTRRVAEAAVVCVAQLQRCVRRVDNSDARASVALAMSYATVTVRLTRMLALPLRTRHASSHGSSTTAAAAVRTCAAQCLHVVHMHTIDIVCALAAQQQQQQQQHMCMHSNEHSHTRQLSTTRRHDNNSSSHSGASDMCVLSSLLVQLQQASCDAVVASSADDTHADRTTAHTTFWLDVLRSYARVHTRERGAQTCVGQQLLRALRHTVCALLSRLLSCRDVTPWVPALCELVACADAATAQPLSALLSHCWATATVASGSSSQAT